MEPHLRKPKTPSEDRRLTNVELELMTILWSLGEGNVAQVIAALPAERALAYTSVSTILRILESKGFVAARREGRGHLYKPTLTKNEYEARAVKDVVNRVFQGVPVAMVRQLLENVAMSDDDVRELRKLVAGLKDRK
jgi:predicted transcriptional regulator